MKLDRKQILKDTIKLLERGIRETSRFKEGTNDLHYKKKCDETIKYYQKELRDKKIELKYFELGKSRPRRTYKRGRTYIIKR